MVSPGESITLSPPLYADPKIQKRLEKISAKLKLTIGLGFLFFIGQPLFELQTFFESLLGNCGWAIIIIKLVFPASRPRVIVSWLICVVLTPTLDRINQLGGYLPIQIPVFVLLHWLLMESIELRQAPFIFWLTALSVKDPLHRLSQFEILFSCSYPFQL